MLRERLAVLRKNGQGEEKEEEGVNIFHAQDAWTDAQVHNHHLPVSRQATHSPQKEVPRT